MDPTGREVEEHRYLDNFFKRLNKVLLERNALANERSRLEEENDELKRILKAYLDGISVGPETMADPTNPLLIVNQRLQRTLRLRQTASMASQQVVEVQAVSAAAAGSGHLGVQGARMR